MTSTENFDKKYLRASNFKKIREFRRKTQTDVVDGTGISKQNVSNWENLKGNPGQEFIDLLAKYFDLPTHVFSMENLTKEYLERNFSSQNGTSVQEPTDNTEMAEIKINLDEYSVIPKEVLKGSQLIAKSEIERMDAKSKSELDRLEAKVQQIIDTKNEMIEQLKEQIRDLKAMALPAMPSKQN